MIIRNLYNSSGKITGYLEIRDGECIKIYNKFKPLLIITDKEIVDAAIDKNIDTNLLIMMYSRYNLCVSEIAAIMDKHYHTANNELKKIFGVLDKKGRRNGSFSKKFSQERIQHMKDGRGEYMAPPPYERTPEIRAKISKGVKAAYARGDLDGRKNAQAGWANGKFDNVDFGRGIAGWMTSKKMNKRFFFRSLLELDYMLRLEYDDDVLKYEYEPFRIKCDNNSYYTPDFLVNDKNVIELKSYKYVYKMGGDVLTKFKYKCSQGRKYCEEHGLNFKVVYDKDIGFKTKKFIHILRDNPMCFNYIAEHDIKFIMPERFFGHKK